MNINCELVENKIAWYLWSQKMEKTHHTLRDQILSSTECTQNWVFSCRWKEEDWGEHGRTFVFEKLVDWDENGEIIVAYVLVHRTIDLLVRSVETKRAKSD